MSLPPRRERTQLRVVISFTADAVIYAEVFDQANGLKLGDLEIERTSNLGRREIESATSMLQSWDVS